MTAIAAGSLILALAPPALAAAPITLQTRLDRLTAGKGTPGALATVREPDGAASVTRSGTAEVGTDKPMIGPEGRFRIASMTKPIMAATVLRLVERGEIDLAAPVERYLPGVVRGTGEGAAIDGAKITVRMLLTQTSGLPEFADVVEWTEPLPDFLEVALARKPTRRGEFAYANTNYLVAGLIVSRVTGKDYQRASRDLVLRPYGMRDTYWPAKGDLGIRGPHAHTYGVHPARPEDGLIDLTDLLPTHDFGPSGGLVSTPADLNRFWSRAPLAAMTRTTVPVRAPGWPAGTRYGFGVARAKLGCGPAWFHGGDMPGASVISGRDGAGQAATVYVTGLAAAPKQRERLLAAFGAALCTR